MRRKTKPAPTGRNRREQRLRKKYPEVHGKVVDFIAHEVQDGMLYVNVWFQDGTKFSLRYSCDMVVVGAELTQLKGGNLKIIREYMRPTPR
jgi:hypothetical protein